MLSLPPGTRNKIPAFACPRFASKPTTGNEGGGVGVGVGTGTSAAAFAAAHDSAMAKRLEMNVDISTIEAIEYPTINPLSPGF
jgi:hypothetical protein